MNQSDLEALERLCPEAEPYEVYLTHHRDIPHFDMLPESFAAIAACIVELARHLNESYCSLYGVEDGNKLFEGLINGMNMDNRKERG